jgi:hypothetical protein
VRRWGHERIAGLWPHAYVDEVTVPPPDGLDLTALEVGDVLRMESELRAIIDDRPTEAAVGVVRYLYDTLRDGHHGPRAVVLARCYRLQTYASLDEEARAFADRLIQGRAAPHLRCLTLVATAGDQLAWNLPAASRSHRAIPLPTDGIVARLPMVAQLLAQFGVTLSEVVDPDPAVLLAPSRSTYNVFHVEEALGSPYVPAQRDFVIPYGVRSALGFGGTLADGDLFAVVLFTKVRVSRETAELFPVLALSVRRALVMA